MQDENEDNNMDLHLRNPNFYFSDVDSKDEEKERDDTGDDRGDQSTTTSNPGSD